ncbi:hypothetical protein ScPMuIL_010481 [Solemya velum]
MKPWYTRMRWLQLRTSPKWVVREDVYVNGSTISQQREDNMRLCDRERRRAPLKASAFGICSERQPIYNRTCLSIEDRNTYRVVQYQPDGGKKYLCLKFFKRSNTVIQIMEGPLFNEETANLCDASQMQLNEWLWIASWRSEVTTCPIQGGFSFRTISRLTNEDFCEAEWRRSRLEVECIRGDGLDFIAPRGSQCNLFSEDRDVRRLHCWASWELGEYIYMVAGAVSQKPQYCLRFPRNVNSQFEALVYFSAICPTDDNGKPPHRIEYYELRMQRIEADACEDEDKERCEKVAKHGACRENSKFVSHCLKSCDICQTNKERLKMQCSFSETYRGYWQLFDRGRHESVYINESHAYFSESGTFICKRKSTDDEKQYKAVSVFQNGCMARYTCLEFERLNNNIMMYRIGQSGRVNDEPVELCQFHDDPSPLTDMYRSYEMKTLVLTGNLWDSYCGLRSSVPFNGTIDGEECVGVISDWDEDRCAERGSLILTPHTCSFHMPREYQCLAYLTEIGALEQRVITRSKDGSDTFNCWILSSYAATERSWPHRVMYRLANTQCSDFTEIQIQLGSAVSTATLYLNDSQQTTHCAPIPNRSTPSLTIGHKNADKTKVTAPTYSSDDPYYKTKKDGVVVPLRNYGNLSTSHKTENSTMIVLAMFVIVSFFWR